MLSVGKLSVVSLLVLLTALSASELRSPSQVQAAPAANHIGHPLIYRPASLSNPGSPPFAPSDLRKAYSFLPLYSRGIQGNSTRIGIVDAFGDRTLSSDLSLFDSMTGLSSASVSLYYPNGVPPTIDQGWALETALDVEWAHAMAPAAKIDLVVAVDANFGSIFNAISYFSNHLANETVLSMSFGASESSYPTTGSDTLPATHQLFVTIASHGTAIFASSGDAGASTCCDVSYPASDPLVVAVGGTSLFLHSNATYSSESAWSGSSAGSSITFSKPSWQQGLGDSMRDIADVSYDGDPNTGVLVIQGGRVFQVGGTSAGAPQWAALIALASQEYNQTFGSISSKLYSLSGFHDITSGSDGFFSATLGWDYPTGLGTPDATAIVDGLAPGTPVPVQTSLVFQGYNVTTSGSLSVNSSSARFSGSLSVRATNAATGTTLFSKIYGLSDIRFQGTTGSLHSSFLLNVQVSPYSLSEDLTLTFRSGTGTVSAILTRQADFAGNGFVSINDVSVVYRGYGLSAGSPGFNPLADLDASGTISIVDIGMIDSLYGIPSFT